MPEYGYLCPKCKKEFKDFNSIADRKTTECECGAVAERNLEIEIKLGNAPGALEDYENWSLSMGVPASQVEVFRKKYPNSIYSDDGRLLVKNWKDRCRQAEERGMVQLDKRR